jgi:hypothetical protein
MKLELAGQIFEKYSNIMKIRPVGAELLRYMFALLSVAHICSETVLLPTNCCLLTAAECRLFSERCTILWTAAPDFCEAIFQTYIQREQLILTTIINDCVKDNVYSPTFLRNLCNAV